MARKPKPSHVVELPLDVNAADARRLLGVFTAGSRLNNVLLQDGLRILDAVRADPGMVVGTLPVHGEEDVSCFPRSAIAEGDAVRGLSV